MRNLFAFMRKLLAFMRSLFVFMRKHFALIRKLFARFAISFARVAVSFVRFAISFARVAISFACVAVSFARVAVRFAFVPVFRIAACLFAFDQARTGSDRSKQGGTEESRHGPLFPLLPPVRISESHRCISRRSGTLREELMVAPDHPAVAPERRRLEAAGPAAWKGGAPAGRGQPPRYAFLIRSEARRAFVES
jgi:hypothetical protein